MIYKSLNQRIFLLYCRKFIKLYRHKMHVLFSVLDVYYVLIV